MKKFRDELKSKLHEALLLTVKASARSEEDGYITLPDDKLNEIISSKDTDTVVKNKYNEVYVLTEIQQLGSEQSDAATTVYYVKLGLLLAIFNRQLKKAETPLVFFNLDVGENRYKTIDGHVSVDATICMLPSTLIGITEGTAGVSTPLVYDILLNVDFIARILDQFLDRYGNIMMLDLFESLFSEIERVTGDINKFELQYYENSSTYVVLDRNFLEPNASESYPELNILGLNSIVKNVNLVTKISSKLSSMVAIAAQASPFTSNTETTGFNSLNADLEQGVTDAIEDEGLELASQKLKDQQTTQEEVLEDFEQSMQAIFQHLRAVYQGKFLDFNNGTDIANTYQNFCTMILGKGKNADYGFIIPFELSIVLHGISGLNVLESFKINKNILPATYGGSRGIDVAFVITGVEHQVDRQGWNTNIRTQIYNVNKKGVLNNGNGYKKYWDLGRVVNATSSSSTQPSPNADLFRAELTKLGYQEKGSELSTGGDLTPSIVKAGTAVAKKIKALYPNMSLVFTGGNDVFHQGTQEYTSRHTAGNAIDFVISPDTSTDVANVEKVLQGFSVGTGGDFRFLNEYTNPTKEATGKHFHISWGGPTEGNSSYAAARALSDDGKLTSYFLV